MRITTWLLAIAASAATFQASASNNTITFQGQITEHTCNVTVNGNSASPMVLLPTVSTGELASANSTAGLTAFEVAVTDCGSLATGTTFSTVFVGNNVTEDGNLGNIGGDAQNVELQILEKEGSDEINLSSGPVSTEGFTLASGANSASRNYYVQYISPSGGATAGAVKGTLQYAITYQ